MVRATTVPTLIDDKCKLVASQRCHSVAASAHGEPVKRGQAGGPIAEACHAQKWPRRDETRREAKAAIGAETDGRQRGER